MKTLTDNQKRNILAPFIADQISNEGLNEDFTAINEILVYFNQREEYIIELLSEERKQDYYNTISIIEDI
jgi:hypothetical protein